MALNAQNVSQHIVKRGETFASIAKKYGISEQQLKKANSKHATCYTGMKLSIPQISETSNASKQISKVENKSNNVQDSQSPIIHTTAKSEEKQADENKDVAQVYGKKEKRKKSFWKKLSSVMSTIGDISVATAEGLVETGLVSENSNAGRVISSSADITHTLRGEELQYDLEDIQSIQFGQNEKAQNKKEQYLVNEINSLQNKYRSLENQANAIKNSKKTVYNQKSREASKALSKRSIGAGDIRAGEDFGLGRSRTIMSQSYAYSAKADKQLTEIYKEMSEIRQNIGKFKSQLSKLRNQNVESTIQSTEHNNTKRECGDCHGLKKCSHCAGRGMKKNSKTGNWHDCVWCRGKGVCPVCKGRGYFTKDTTLDPVN